jgi:hypothetical protein
MRTPWLFKIALVLAVICAVLCVVTLVSPEWIEELTGLEPDAGGGESEWSFALGFGLAAVLSGALAWWERRRLARSAPE